jgi:hypothetical protein
MMKSKLSQISDPEFTKKISRPSFGEHLLKKVEDQIQANKEKMYQEAKEENYPEKELLEDIEMMEKMLRESAQLYITNWTGIKRIMSAIERKYGQSFADSLHQDVFNMGRASTLTPEDVVYLVIETEKMCNQSSLTSEQCKEKLSQLSYRGVAAIGKGLDEVKKEIEEKNRRLQERALKLQQMQAENEALKLQLGLTSNQDKADSSSEKTEGKWAEFTKILDTTKKRDVAEAEIDSSPSTDNKQSKQKESEQTTSADGEKINDNSGLKI